MGERCGIWQLDHVLAVGGIGEVWQATRCDSAGESDSHDARNRLDAPDVKVAVKLLHSHLMRHELVRAMFDNERRLLLELPRHPAVAYGLDRGEIGDRPWVAMVRANGIDLRRHLDGGAPTTTSARPPRRLATTTALHVVACACDAVAHLHDHGWVHGDVVPANLVIDDDLSSVVLCDLGVARRSGDGGPVQGTHAYMAPEQIRGEPWTPATDVFALGVLLWELVQGRRLFHRGPSWLSMQAVLEEDAPALADRMLDDIARDALARDASARIADARSLAHRLEACGVVIST
jgi:eukaryotic-like serine/threonine-protein kinase